MADQVHKKLQAIMLNRLGEIQTRTENSAGVCGAVLVHHEMMEEVFHVFGYCEGYSRERGSSGRNPSKFTRSPLLLHNFHFCFPCIQPARWSNAISLVPIPCPVKAPDGVTMDEEMFVEWRSQGQ
jgi:hypothetical protein